MNEQELEQANERWTIRLAELEIERLRHDRENNSDQHMASFRWLLASLLAVNGGLAIAVLGSDDIGAHAKAVAGSLSFFGVALALLSAKLAQMANDAFAPIINKNIGYWGSVAEYRLRVPEDEERLNAEIKATAKRSKWVPITGWLSGMAFGLAATTVGVALWAAPSGGKPSITPAVNHLLK